MEFNNDSMESFEINEEGRMESARKLGAFFRGSKPKKKEKKERV